MTRTDQHDLSTMYYMASPLSITLFSTRFDTTVDIFTWRLLSQGPKIRHQYAKRCNSGRTLSYDHPRRPTSLIGVAGFLMVRRDGGGFPNTPSPSSNLISHPILPYLGDDGSSSATIDGCFPPPFLSVERSIERRVNGIEGELGWVPRIKAEEGGELRAKGKETLGK